MNSQWKMVPVEPTKEQTLAVCMHPDLARSLYRSMVLAAPVPPAGEGLDANELSALRICAKLGYSTTPEVLLRLLDMVKPALPAVDVPEYFVAACDKFDWTPEEALRFYAEGKHFDTADGRTRILCTGAIASHALKGLAGPYADMKGIEPAGDVEVLERARKIELLREAFEQRFKLDIWPVIDWLRNAGLDDRAHVTRLTAERDGLKYKAELYDEVWSLATGLGYMNVKTAITTLQSELTKARELLGRLERAGLRTKAQGIEVREFLAHQSAPAAKGDSQ